MRMLMLFLLLIPCFAQSQESLRYSRKLEFSPTKVRIIDSNPVFGGEPVFFCWSAPGYNPDAVIKGKTYEAFFCRLEVKTEKVFGLGVQFHAGDYNFDMRNRFYR